MVYVSIRAGTYWFIHSKQVLKPDIISGAEKDLYYLHAMQNGAAMA